MPWWNVRLPRNEPRIQWPYLRLHTTHLIFGTAIESTKNQVRGLCVGGDMVILILVRSVANGHFTTDPALKLVTLYICKILKKSVSSNYPKNVKKGQYFSNCFFSWNIPGNIPNTRRYRDPLVVVGNRKTKSRLTKTWEKWNKSESISEFEKNIFYEFSEILKSQKSIRKFYKIRKISEFSRKNFICFELWSILRLSVIFVATEE